MRASPLLLLVLAGLALTACPGGNSPQRPDIPVDPKADAPSGSDLVLGERLVSPESSTAKDGSGKEGGSPGADSAPPAGCKPYCYPPGSKSQGWYDGCTKQMLKLPGTNYPYNDSCDGCSAVCKSVGQPAEGWYSSCTDQLIVLIKCG